jgi:hypothetical protein
MIVSTNLINNMPIGFNQSTLDLRLYTNEPSTCKWSQRDQNYEKMENEMKCATTIKEINAQMVYECSTTLIGIKSQETNNFYFRCMDQPLKPEKDRNVNTQSYKFSVIGTQPLKIDWVKPNETIRDSTQTVKVTLEAHTSAGYKEGQALCYYSDTGGTDSYIMFYYESSGNLTGSYAHKQDVYLASGSYKYYIKCIDLGGNSDEKTVSFNVESDNSPPVVVRIFKEENNLQLVTNEKAECVYDSVDCNYLFKDGSTMSSTTDGKSHFTTWNKGVNYYIKCKDEYGNEPAPNSCSISARAFEIYGSSA